ADDQLGQLDAALVDYRAAMELAPPHPGSRLACAAGLVRLGRAAAAQQHLRPDAPWAAAQAACLQALGHIAHLEGDPAAALQHFGEARILAPDDGDILEDLFRAQVDAHDFVEAGRTARSLQTLNRYATRPDLRQMHALCLV